LIGPKKKSPGVFGSGDAERAGSLAATLVVPLTPLDAAHPVELESESQ